MRLLSTLVVTLLAQFVSGWTPAKRSYDTHDYYVVGHDLAGGASPADVARALGTEVVEQLGELQDYWLVRIPKPSVLPRGDNFDHFDPVIRSFNELRSLADGSAQLNSRSEDTVRAREIVSSVTYLSARQELRQRAKRAPPIPPPHTYPSVQDDVQKFGIVDPLFPQQWHLVNQDHPQHMMNVTSLWEMGFTGKGIISSVIDDGLDYTSDDLVANFVCIPSSLLISKLTNIWLLGCS